MSNRDIMFTPAEFEAVSKYLMGSQIRPYPNIIVPQSAGMARVQPREEVMMQKVFESCPFRGAMSFVVGGALGAFLGLFSSSMAPHQTVQMTTRETLIDMRNTITSSAPLTLIRSAAEPDRSTRLTADTTPDSGGFSLSRSAGSDFCSTVRALSLP